MSTETGFILPPRLLNLDVSELMNSEGECKIEILPFDLPATLQNLKISHISSLQTLPSLSLGSLKSIELFGCNSLSSIPPFPQSLLKLVIYACDQIESLNLPNNLEELSCEWCKKLELDLSNLPAQLKILSIKNCDRTGKAAQLDQLPVHLKDLELEGFYNIVGLPSLPSGLHSLCLQLSTILTRLPILPASLRKLTLEKLPVLENMVSLPDNLKELTLRKCEVNELDHIPHKLKSLKIVEMKLLHILSFNLPDTLEYLKISNSPNIEPGFEKYLLEMGSHTGSPFPPKLRVLELQRFKSIKILPTLPISLEKLVLIDCKSIIEFPLLPPNLRELKIFRCDQIKFIGSDDIFLEGIGFHGKIPTSLKTIGLYNLEIAWIGELPPNLESLSIYNCDASELTVSSSLPRHLVQLTIRN
jgi:hypothetical protein